MRLTVWQWKRPTKQTNKENTPKIYESYMLPTNSGILLQCLHPHPVPKYVYIIWRNDRSVQVLWIFTGFNADPDPAFKVNADQVRIQFRIQF